MTSTEQEQSVPEPPTEVKAPEGQNAEEAETVTPVAEATGPVVAALWLPESSRERLRALGWRVSAGDGDLDNAELVLVSTRAPRARVIPLVRSMRSSGTTVAVVCHAGGDTSALEIVRAGASACVSEGNETALVNVLSGPDDEEGTLVVTFEKRTTSLPEEAAWTESPDSRSLVPGQQAFATRVDELERSGIAATIGVLQIAGFDRATAGLDLQAIDVLRRRMATLLAQTTACSGAELYALADARYAFVAQGGLEPAKVQQLGAALVRTVRAFAPSGVAPLRVGVGHAGPDIASDVSIARELAERAAEAAVADGADSVVGAEHLSATLVSATELDIAIRLVGFLEGMDGYPGSHSKRVSGYATELARHLGLPAREVVRVQLAALLHDIGKVGLPPEAMRESADQEPEALGAYRSHPERGARYAQVTAGRLVAEAIKAHHERWDGSGFPEGLAGDQIPLAARIIAVADVYDALRTAAGSERSSEECVAAVRELAGSVLDPDVVATAELVLPR